MIYLAIALFAVSAALGLTILIKWLTKKNAPKSVVYSHGIVAASALLLLIGYALQHPDHFPKISIVIFVIAAIGGFYMFIRSMNNKTSPLIIAFVHALLALSGFISLLLFVFA
jgi:hypothetical protein